MNIIFTTVVFILVLLQVAFLVRLDLEGVGGVEVSYTASLIHVYATRYINNLAFTFIPVLLLVNIAREFDYAIVQRSLVSGLSRPGFFFAKLIQLGLFSLIALLLAIAFTLIYSAIYWVKLVWNDWWLFSFMVVSFCLGSLALMIAFIVKKRIYALVAFIGYSVLENTMAALLPGKILLLPFQTCIRLLRHGIHELPELVMITMYTLLFLVIAYQAFRRSDLK